jgi:hypothetical protein
MKTALIVAAALAATFLTAPAHAAGDVVCSMRDTLGNNLTYAFGSNSFNANGTFGGTMVETGFKKNGTAVVSDVGQRPIWVYGSNAIGGFSLYSRAAPGWTLNVVSNGAAMLTHNGRFAGNGFCNTPLTGATQADVGDLGH